MKHWTRYLDEGDGQSTYRYEVRKLDNIRKQIIKLKKQIGALNRQSKLIESEIVSHAKIFYSKDEVREAKSKMSKTKK